MKDLRIIARVVNNQMRERREAMDGGAGITQTEAARRAGIPVPSYCSMENMKESPIDRRPCKLGRWTSTATKIAALFGVEPAVLWPASVRDLRARLAERRVNAEELHALACPPPDASPFGLIAAGEEAAAVRAAVEALPEQQRVVLAARFGFDDEPRTLVEIADDMGLSRERIRQVETVALREVRRKMTA